MGVREGGEEEERTSRFLIVATNSRKILHHFCSVENLILFKHNNLN